MTKAKLSRLSDFLAPERTTSTHTGTAFQWIRLPGRGVGWGKQKAKGWGNRATKGVAVCFIVLEGYLYTLMNYESTT